jgi:hypothetical protein
MECGKASGCRCGPASAREPARPGAIADKTVRPVLSVVLAVLVAFFPKCPVCWAAYMSMLGSHWLAGVPYLSWLLPVLVALMGVYLLLLLKSAPQKGYGPFLLSLAGGVVIVGGRGLFPLERWVVFAGMPLVLAGSLLHSFSADQIERFVSKVPEGGQ